MRHLSLLSCFQTLVSVLLLNIRLFDLSVTKSVGYSICDRLALYHFLSASNLDTLSAPLSPSFVRVLFHFRFGTSPLSLAFRHSTLDVLSFHKSVILPPVLCIRSNLSHAPKTKVTLNRKCTPPLQFFSKRLASSNQYTYCISYLSNNLAPLAEPPIGGQANSCLPSYQKAGLSTLYMCAFALLLYHPFAAYALSIIYPIPYCYLAVYFRHPFRQSSHLRTSVCFLTESSSLPISSLPAFYYRCLYACYRLIVLSSYMRQTNTI